MDSSVSDTTIQVNDRASRTPMKASDGVEGDTPLHIAARRGDTLEVKRLIGGQGAIDVQMTNTKGQLALGLADEEKHCDTCKALVNAIRSTGKERIKDSLWTKHSGNGATLLHFFAGYGTSQDLEWIVKECILLSMINEKDNEERNVVHWAAMKGNKEAVEILARNNADLNADCTGGKGKTPLAIAFTSGNKEFAEELLKWRPKKTSAKEVEWVNNISIYYYNFSNEKDAEFLAAKQSLEDGYKKHTKSSWRGFPKLFLLEIPPIYLALHAGEYAMADFLQKHSRVVDGAVNESGKHTKRTALHWATILNQKKIVEYLCKQEELAVDVEDVLDKTALQYAFEMKDRGIQRHLMKRDDVGAYVESMYKDRQAYVDAANAILVGAALIASVTFAGWLQPPLGYQPDYNVPPLPPPADTYPSYVAEKHISVRVFCALNSLSFGFAIATIISCLVGMLPVPRTYIATTVHHLRRYLRTSSFLLLVSVLSVLGAFAAAGFAIMPPKHPYIIMVTAIAGGIPCVVLWALFVRRVWPLRPRWLKRLEKKVLKCCCRTTPPASSPS